MTYPYTINALPTLRAAKCRAPIKLSPVVQYPLFIVYLCSVFLDNSP